MKKLFDEFSAQSSKLVTQKYSTSFSLAVKLLSPKIRTEIYNIYGFVRLADEIVDSFHDYNKEELLNEFEAEYYNAFNRGISLNPIINAFQHTVKKYNIENEMVQSFLDSMRADLTKNDYTNVADYNTYIYGSADVVGLMCLKVFVNGNNERFEQLKEPAMKLGSAFQKVNFLRDLKDDFEILNRSYFPNVDLKNLSSSEKNEIIAEIKTDFDQAYKGIVKLPLEARLGVLVAYKYYLRLLFKIEQTNTSEIMQTRIRVNDFMKLVILGDSYVRYQLKLY